MVYPAYFLSSFTASNSVSVFVVSHQRAFDSHTFVEHPGALATCVVLPLVFCSGLSKL